VGRGEPGVSYAMVTYFDVVHTIIEYGISYDMQFENSSFRICPLIDQHSGLRIWFGSNPEDPPLRGVPLEQATSMTIEEFSKLMTGNPNNACFNLKEEAFPK
jgi:hypothetical protein